MKIIVCIKQIRHTYARSGQNPDSFYLAEKDQIYRLNPYNEYALEMALEQKSKYPDIEIIVLTLGPLVAEVHLRRCLALGADDVVRIDTRSEEEPGSWQKSGLLARAIQELGGDIVLCGKASLDRQSGQMGAFLARRLNVPFLSDISSMDVSQNMDQVQLKRKGERGSRQIWRSQVPAVFSVGTESENPPVPSLKERRRAMKLPIRSIYYPLSDHQRLVRSVRVFPPHPRTKRLPAPDSSLPAYDRINALLTGSTVNKQSQMLTGSIDERVEGIVSFLDDQGFLKP